MTAVEVYRTNRGSEALKLEVWAGGGGGDAGKGQVASALALLRNRLAGHPPSHAAQPTQPTGTVRVPHKHEPSCMSTYDELQSGRLQKSVAGRPIPYLGRLKVPCAFLEERPLGGAGLAGFAQPAVKEASTKTTSEVERWRAA